MERLILVVVLVAAAVVVALVLQRRARTAKPVQGRNWTVPPQLARTDFAAPTAPWLVAVFTSTTCDSCAGTWEKARQLESAEVGVDNISYQERRDLHDRYGIDAVPTLVVADREGAVRASFVGPISATDLWGAVAELREPGTMPPGCDHGR